MTLLALPAANLLDVNPADIAAAVSATALRAPASRSISLQGSRLALLARFLLLGLLLFRSHCHLRPRNFEYLPGNCRVSFGVRTPQTLAIVTHPAAQSKKWLSGLCGA